MPNVGIGTTSPTEALEVSGNALIDNTLFAGGINSSGVTSSLNDGTVYSPTGSAVYPGYAEFTASNSNNFDSQIVTTAYGVTNLAGTGQVAYVGAVAVAGTGSHTPDIVIGQSTGSSSYAERMRIDSTGNVGIGTPSPNATLDIKPSGAAAILIEPYGTSAGNTGENHYQELAANGTTYVGFKAPDSITSSKVWTLPAADGSNGQVLQTNGSGTLSWTAVQVSGGSDTIAKGAAGTPALNFTGDTTTGLYDVSSGTIGMAASGSNILTISSGNVSGAGALTVAAGGSDQNLTLQSTGTGSINISSGNGTSLSVLDGGTSTVDYVTVKGSAAGGIPMIATAGTDTNINMAIMPKGTGQVGIGTTSPSSALTVNGAVQVGTTAATCTASNKGAIRYNTTTNILEFCNGTAWNTVQVAACSNATPTAFSFTNLANQSTSTLVTSNIVQIAGINCLVPTTISGNGSPAYQICQDAACGTVLQSWTTGPSSIQSGQYIQVELTTSASGGVSNNATMIVGGAGSVWSATTTGSCSFGATETAAIGTRCSDGTVYAGLSPDGNNPMYATPCDYSQTWNSGTQTCTGSATTLTWNNGTTNYTTTGYNSTATGYANSTGLDSKTSNADYPYTAAQDCLSLTTGSHSDWYLPAQGELNVLYNNHGVIGNFNTSVTYYWSSTEDTSNLADVQRFSDGFQTNNGKTNSYLVRCVRKY